MKFSQYISYLLLLPAILFTACEDIIPYDPVVIGEGEATVSAELEFHPLEPALESRAPGNAVDQINQLWMVIYKVNANGEEEKLYEKIKIYSSNQTSTYILPESDFEIDQTGNSSDPGDAESSTPTESDPTNIGPSGQKTPRATFKLKNIPYGRYKMFAVANVDLNDESIDCSIIAGLRSTRFTWSEDVSKDNQMFGYFTLTGTGNETARGDAPVLIVNDKTVSLHSWVRRLVSKVTVSFDASGLYENVRIYIKSVTIRDIPLTCPLGESNTPTSLDSLIADGESFLYYNEGEGDNSQHEKWKMVLSKGDGVKGNGKDYETDHSEAAPSLYFFENMQGNYPNDPLYDKRQDPDAVGTPIDKLEDGPDYKDTKLYGTYIEVEGYYDSRNKDKISQGPIKYRFMLGKNTTYNYNAERNYHYKLTLKFRGWANEADWHISYREYRRTLITPEPYYISYLYGQEMEFPARVLLMEGDNPADFQIKAEIVENNWWPWDRDANDGKGARPDEFVGAADNINGFAWNKESFEKVYSYIPYTPEYYKEHPNMPYEGSNYVGFLSLKPNQTEMIGSEYDYGAAANVFLKDFYKTNQDGLAVNYYELTGPQDPIDKSIRVKIPMYTRNKEMVPASDFSGNNPFNSYYRFAKVRFTLWMKDEGEWTQIPFLNEDGKEENERVATIYQVPRIENPKAIYRDWDNDDSFEIKLMILPKAGTSTYEAFKSDGPWRAYIKCQTEDFIELSKGSTTINTTDKYIEGSTDEIIQFTYKPKDKLTSSNQVRCGIIAVEYHDYNCTHLIFVRQGYHAGIKMGSATWSCYNVYSARCGTNLDQVVPSDHYPAHGNKTAKDDGPAYVVLTNSPLSIGSLLKRCQYNYSILESNNKDYGWLGKIGSLNTTYIDIDNNIQERKMNWDGFWGYAWCNSNASENRYYYHWADTWHPVKSEFEKDQEFAVPTAEDYNSLLSDGYSFGYGIAYADGAKSTVESFADTNGFIDYNNDGIDDGYNATDPESSSRGMRVCVVYDSQNGNNILFPLGSIGQGRRARDVIAINDTKPEPLGNPGPGSLTYSGIIQPLYNSKTNNNNWYRPMTFDVYRTPGALYWVYQPVLTADGKPKYASWDINYLTLVFNPFAEGSLGGWDTSHDKLKSTSKGYSSDALPIKLIYKK